MKEIKPVKRSKQLAPLSREHHDALMFIWKIKEGLKNGTPPAIISGYINWYWKNNLQSHFEQEEKLLLPHLPVNDDLAAKLKKEHETIRRLINKMDDNSVTLLADTLNAHIRFEERQLFPHVERVVSVEQLNEIFGQLAHQPQCETQWSNAFWIK